MSSDHNTDLHLEDQRREYRFAKLTREGLRDSPFEQFQGWLAEAMTSGIPDPTAMSVATVDSGGRPWQRIVLLKHFDDKGFVFYTNLGSRKAREIGNNPCVSLLFPWFHMERQVIVGGVARRLKVSEVLKYFVSCLRESQLAAWASRQSSRLTSRQALEAQFMQMKEKFHHGDIPLPDFWGGFRVEPDEFEFWQGGENRLHDRFQYLRKEGGKWGISRLAP
jgi:pyridoxamine 5'-phosphate oxidase